VRYAFQLAFVVVGLSIQSGFAHADDAHDVAKKLEGTWIVESVTLGGKATSPPKGSQVIFADAVMITKPTQGREQKWKFKVDPSKKPNEIDFEFADEVSKGIVPKGIFELGGDSLKLCTHPNRPKEISDQGQRLWVLKRAK